MKYIVDRSTWLRGGKALLVLARSKGDKDMADVLTENGKFHHNPVSYLRHPRHACMCCLGHVLQQCGVPESDMANKSVPSAMVGTFLHKIPPFLLEKSSNNPALMEDSRTCTEAMSINDCDTYSDKTREKCLIKLFAKAGHELEFVGEYFIGELITDSVQW